MWGDKSMWNVQGHTVAIWGPHVPRILIVDYTFNYIMALNINISILSLFVSHRTTFEIFAIIFLDSKSVNE